ncbi:unnamed protein product, partial [Allacma fusca]
MDNDQEIFSVSEDNDIVINAEEKITQQQVIKVPAEMTLPRSKSSPSLHSGNINPDNLLEQDGSPLSTSKSLRDLLDSWIDDDKLDEREKRKQILK